MSQELRCARSTELISLSISVAIAVQSRSFSVLGPRISAMLAMMTFRESPI